MSGEGVDLVIRWAEMEETSTYITIGGGLTLTVTATDNDNSCSTFSLLIHLNRTFSLPDMTNIK